MFIMILSDVIQYKHNYWLFPFVYIMYWCTVLYAFVVILRNTYFKIIFVIVVRRFLFYFTNKYITFLWHELWSKRRKKASNQHDMNTEREKRNGELHFNYNKIVNKLMYSLREATENSNECFKCILYNLNIISPFLLMTKTQNNNEINLSWLF